MLAGVMRVGPNGVCTLVRGDTGSLSLPCEDTAWRQTTKQEEVCTRHRICESAGTPALDIPPPECET